MKHLRILTLLVLVISISLIFAACDNSQHNHETPTTNPPTEAPTEVPTHNNTEHTHTFSEATCTVPKTCECSATEGSPKGHSYADVVTAPNCTEAGYTTHICVCGDKYTDTPVAALGHAFENGACGVCDEADPDFVAHTHSYTSVVTAPTCTTKGFTTHTCACGEIYSDHTIDAPGHKYENGVCKACGETDPYYVPHTHSYTSTVTAPTCTKAGYTTHTCTCGDSYTDSEVEALSHKYENGSCKTCGEADPNYEAPHTHSYTSTVTAPTCTKAGYTTHTCACRYSYTDSPVDALGHKYENGTCQVCGEADPEYKEDSESGEEIKKTTVSKSHKEIATIANVTAGQNTGNIADKNIALDDYITIICAKGKSTANPCIYNESIRLYQGGATITVKVAEGATMETIVITLATSSDGHGPISVMGGKASALTNNTYTITVNEGVSEVVITTAGTDKSSRLYISNIAVTYTGESTDSESDTGYVKVTKAEDFISGTYIIVTSTGVGLGAYDNGWITVSNPTIENEIITDGSKWTLTVNGSSLTLMDANGKYIKPNSGNTNGITTGEYNWTWSMNANGLVTFMGAGKDTTTLASNTGSQGKFRAYKNTTVSGNTTGYPSEFVVYKLVE